jgi:hypothetical protein
MYTLLVESGQCVKGTKYLVAPEVLENILDIWERKAVFNGVCIQHTIIHYKSQATTMGFWNEERRGAPWAIAGFDDSLEQPFVQ